MVQKLRRGSIVLRRQFARVQFTLGVLDLKPVCHRVYQYLKNLCVASVCVNPHATIFSLATIIESLWDYLKPLNEQQNQ